MEKFFTNPGLVSIGEMIFQNLDYQSLVMCQNVCHSWKMILDKCTTDIPIKPINRPINRIGKSDKSQYRIGIGSADYKGLYRLIGFGSKMSLI